MKIAEILSPNDQIDTPEFQRWFAGSKAVDDNGQPLRLYHGTNIEINSFATRQNMGRRRFYAGELGAWFATTPMAANVFARQHNYGNPAVYPVYLRVLNPKEYDGYAPFIDAAYRITRNSAAAMRKLLMQSGYDGVVIHGSTTDSGGLRDDWVVFNPTQVKSAIGNKGSFSQKRRGIGEQISL